MQHVQPILKFTQIFIQINLNYLLKLSFLIFIASLLQIFSI